MKIDRDDFGRMLFQKLPDGFRERFPGWFGRKIINHAFPIMFDSKQVKEVTNHFPVRAEQPDLEQLNGEVIEALRGERLLKPDVSLALRLSFNENWPELSAGSNILNHG